MKLKPLADRVVLKQNAAEERTSSGIFLTASAQEKPEVYEVVEVGPGGMVDGNQVDMIVKAGQQVLVGKYIHHRPSERHPRSHRVIQHIGILRRLNYYGKADYIR